MQSLLLDKEEQFEAVGPPHSMITVGARVPRVPSTCATIGC